MPARGRSGRCRSRRCGASGGSSRCCTRATNGGRSARMIEITRWLDRQARRDRRRHSLEAALLSRSLRPYVMYRLRYFRLRLASLLAVHLVTILFLYQAFSGAALVSAVAAHALAALSIGFWWGALETLRGRIRTLRANAQPHLIEAQITRWLSLSGRVAAVVAGLTVVWSVERTIVARRVGPADAYQAAIFLRLALQIVTLTLHSGVFAIRRIYRPPWAIVAVELAGFAAAVVFWPIAGAWSLPLASFLAGLASNAIVVAYTLRAYRLIGIAGGSLIRASIRQRPPADEAWRDA